MVSNLSTHLGLSGITVPVGTRHPEQEPVPPKAPTNGTPVMRSDGKPTGKTKRAGMLIPEFPGQTHNFFWRETQALKELGADVVFFSTRRPPPGLRSTTWGQKVMEETHFLFPMSAVALLRVAWLLLSSPTRAVRCWRAFMESVKGLHEQESPIRLLGLMAIGIHVGLMCEDLGVEHLHVHSCADAANIALFAHAASGLSYSLTLHNPLAIWGGNQVNKWHNAKFGIVIADWILRDLQARLGDALPANLVIAPMGVNTDVFQRTRPYTPANDGVVLVFSCARLNPAKGFEVLLEAVAAARATGLDVQLHIAGEDDSGGTGYRKVLEAAIRRLGLGPAVRLLGAVSEEHVRAELEAAHVFALASFEEPLGVAIMEAMAMGVPTVATNAGGVPSIISHGVDGLLVPPSDPAALASAITAIAGAPEMALGLSARGRLRIVDAFHHRLSAQAIFDNL